MDAVREDKNVTCRKQRPRASIDRLGQNGTQFNVQFSSVPNAEIKERC